MITAIILFAAFLTILGVRDLAKTSYAIRQRERALEERCHERLHEDVRTLWAQRQDGFPHADRVTRKVQRNHGAR